MGEGLCSSFRVVPVTFRDVRTGHDDFSKSAERQQFSCVDVDNLAADYRRENPARSRLCNKTSARGTSNKGKRHTPGVVLSTECRDDSVRLSLHSETISAKSEQRERAD